MSSVQCRGQTIISKGILASHQKVWANTRRRRPSNHLVSIVFFFAVVQITAIFNIEKKNNNNIPRVLPWSDRTIWGFWEFWKLLVENHQNFLVYYSSIFLKNLKFHSLNFLIFFSSGCVAIKIKGWVLKKYTWKFKRSFHFKRESGIVSFIEKSFAGTGCFQCRNMGKNYYGTLTISHASYIRFDAHGLSTSLRIKMMKRDRTIDSSGIDQFPITLSSLYPMISSTKMYVPIDMCILNTTSTE